MKLKVIQAEFQRRLTNIYDLDEVNSFFYLLLDAYFGISKVQLALDHSLTISENKASRLYDALKDLENHKPVQQILGYTEFYGLNFKVNSNVLIPRPETEELVDLIIKENVKTNDLNVLDIGTGSGCIAISLSKHLKNAQVKALDVSEEAIEVAEENARLNNVNINFIEANIFDRKKMNFDLENGFFDVIVSNPPYVRHKEKKEMKRNVVEYDPHIALFVEDTDPLIFYRTICELSVDKLAQNGRLYFEINQYLGEAMNALMEEFQFKDIQLIKDFSGNDRIVKARK